MTGNNRHETSNLTSTVKRATSFDYIIVGAGPSAMGLLLGMLEPYKESKDPPPFTIAILERGSGPPHDPLTHGTSSWFEAAHKTHSTSVSQITTEITGRTMELPIGRGLGGTSNVNALLCTPPLAQDFETWPDSWKRILPDSVESIKSKLMESNSLCYSIDSLEGVSSPFSEKDTDTLFSRVLTMAGKTSEGRFVRRNYYDALVAPLLQSCPLWEKNHLHWFQDTEAQRLIFDGNRISGIECYKKSNGKFQKFKIDVSRELILCAGAIETPVLLMVSGIGKEKPPQGVGRHLKDQVILPCAYLTNWRKNSNLSSNGIVASKYLHTETDIYQVILTDATSHVGILPHLLAMAVRRRWNGISLSRIWRGIFEGLFRAIKTLIKFSLSYTPLGYVAHHFTTATILVLLHPHSEGKISTKVKQDFVSRGEPLMRQHIEVDVDVGYLSDYRDMDTMKNCWRAYRSTAQFFEILPFWMFSPLKILGIDWFAWYCRFFAFPYYHFCGTCTMQTEKYLDWVVDADLLLRGHEGIRICDSSVFPSMVSNPPALTCAALGYSFATSLTKK